jgi:DNA-binding response OmpR family regulator
VEGFRVLVVDNNATNWRMRPVTAYGGPAALELLDAANSGAPLRLLILDVNMPVMDGYVSKPPRAANLFAALEKLLPHPSQTGMAAR